MRVVHGHYGQRPRELVVAALYRARPQARDRSDHSAITDCASTRARRWSSMARDAAQPGAVRWHQHAERQRQNDDGDQRLEQREAGAVPCAAEQTPNAQLQLRSAFDTDTAGEPVDADLVSLAGLTPA